MFFGEDWTFGPQLKRGGEFLLLLIFQKGFFLREEAKFVLYIPAGVLKFYEALLGMGSLFLGGKGRLILNSDFLTLIDDDFNLFCLGDGSP